MPLYFCFRIAPAHKPLKAPFLQSELMLCSKRSLQGKASGMSIFVQTVGVTSLFIIFFLREVSPDIIRNMCVTTDLNKKFPIPKKTSLEKTCIFICFCV